MEDSRFSLIQTPILQRKQSSSGFFDPSLKHLPLKEQTPIFLRQSDINIIKLFTIVIC